MVMSLAENKTFKLWQSFMSERKAIRNKLGAEMFSIQVYRQPIDFGNLNQEFEKWAAVEVANFDTIPDGMEPFILEGGLYAVFLYKGAASAGGKAFQYIFGTWLPGSGYLLDDRPHFEILGERYKNEDPDSEEEIWIPIKTKE